MTPSKCQNFPPSHAGAGVSSNKVHFTFRWTEEWTTYDHLKTWCACDEHIFCGDWFHNFIGFNRFNQPPYKVTDHLSPGPATCEAEDWARAICSLAIDTGSIGDVKYVRASPPRWSSSSDSKRIERIFLWIALVVSISDHELQYLGRLCPFIVDFPMKNCDCPIKHGDLQKNLWIYGKKHPLVGGSAIDIAWYSWSLLE